MCTGIQGYRSITGIVQGYRCSILVLGLYRGCTGVQVYNKVQEYRSSTGVYGYRCNRVVYVYRSNTRVPGYRGSIAVQR